jgi:site-specific DNA recombinase
MAIRVGLYARYSTDMQNDASIEDQLRVCREYASRQGWIVVDSYSDRAKSGASMVRPGLQDLIQDAANRRFEAVLAEALDRFSRDQEDIAGIFKRMTYVGVQMATVAEGEVNEMHIGLKGTMNALFLKDLAAKTHRGLRGRVEAGKSGGGNAYGYKVVRRFGPDNTPSNTHRLRKRSVATGNRFCAESGGHPWPSRQGMGTEHDQRPCRTGNRNTE